MARPLKPATVADVRRVARAIAQLREARDDLAAVGADRAANRVRAALASAEGARRHIERRAGGAPAVLAVGGEG